jgi:hypothetical protein
MKAIRAKQAPLPKRASVLCTFLILTITTFLLAGCAVKLIGDYDSAFDSGITDIQQKAELYFAKLQSTPNTPYDQSFYDDIDSHLAVLKTRATVEPKNQILVSQFTNLKAQFDDFEKLDKTSTRPFPSAAVTAAQSGIETSVESILKLELALKGGGKSPPELAN